MRSPPSRVERMHYSRGGAGLGHTSVGRVLPVPRSGRVCPGSRGNRSRFTLTGIHQHQGAVPQALTQIRRARFIVWRLRRPFLGECQRVSRHFGNARHVCATALRPESPKKALCHTCLVGGTEDKYR